MRLTRKKVDEIIGRILGEEGLSLVKLLYGKENISEFDLAKRAKKDIKVIRRMLYVLYNNNLVGFSRKKDKEKGWYIYYWTILLENIKFLYYKKKRELLVRLEEQLEKEEKELFFVCPNNCVRLNFDEGMDFEFHCPECGELIAQDNSERKIIFLKKEIKSIKEEFAQLEKEEKALRQKAKARMKVVKTKVKVKKVKKKVAKKKPTKKVKKKVVKKAKKKSIKAKTKAKVSKKKIKPKKTSKKSTKKKIIQKKKVKKKK